MKIHLKVLLILAMLTGPMVMDAFSKLRCKVKIARQRDCKGFGICVMVFYEFDASDWDFKPPADADFNENKQFTLTFEKDPTAPKGFYEKYFSGDEFVCEDDFSVPDNILKELGYNGSYKIQAGKYPIEVEGNKYIVTF